MKLHPGCGKQVKPGWINVEISSRFEKLTPQNIEEAAKGEARFRMNLLHPFPLEDNSIDFIYWEHVIEHFDLIDLRYILKEFRRVLKPGGVVRTACPDLDKFIELYDDDKYVQLSKKWYDVQVKKKLSILSKAHMLNLALTSHGHEFTHNFESAKKEFELAGFDKVVRCEYNSSSHKELTNLETRSEEQNPLIFEAS